MIYKFVESSSTKHAILERTSKEMNIKLKYLKSLSSPMWACRSEAIQAVKNNYTYSVLQLCLTEMSKSINLSEVKVT